MLWQVVLADFFLADQLTSQVFMFRNIEFLVCYYSGGYFHNRDEDACYKNTTFRQLMFVFSLLPYWYRFLQVRSFIILLLCPSQNPTSCSQHLPDTYSRDLLLNHKSHVHITFRPTRSLGIHFTFFVVTSVIFLIR